MDNTLDGLYIAPAFMDKLVVHITKNFLNLPNIKVLYLFAKISDINFPTKLTKLELSVIRFL